MNFYRAQDAARRQTTLLVALFSLAVVSLVLITNIVVAMFVWYSDPASFLSVHPDIDQQSGLSKFWAILLAYDPAKAAAITIIVCGGIGAAILFKWLSLRSGGAVVAESMGGRRVLPNTDSLQERQLLNVVEEMALASGIAVPPVYVMAGEQGINAFAAGMTTSDAVIGVSQGALNSLNREQLQGVVAHEFSHIFNGDMRMNLRIVAVLHGILMIAEAGRFFLDLASNRRSFRSSRDRGNAAGFLFAFGLALFLIGWLGQFFGGLIKAAVSRQREFLADASAVQYTRNANGIAGALRVIGGTQQRSYLKHRNAHEFGHLFFSQAFRSNWFATHPPLDARIKAVLPTWRGDYLKADNGVHEPAPKDPMHELRSQLNSQPNSQLNSQLSSGQVSAGAVSPEADVQLSDVKASVADDFALQQPAWVIPGSLRSAVHEPLSAQAIVLGLLLDKDEQVRLRQKEAILSADEALAAQLEIFSDTVFSLEIAARLPVVELAMPALKSLSSTQYQDFRKAMLNLIRADGQVDLWEWVLFELIRQQCDRHLGLAKAPKLKFKTSQSVAPVYAIVLSRLVIEGNTDEDQRDRAFGLAANAAGCYTAKRLPIDQCSTAAFTRAVHELRQAYPLLKPRLLKGLVQAARSDDLLHAKEHAMISAIAMIWDCPVFGLDL